MRNLKGARLLVLSDRYPHIGDPISSSFVKSQIECLKDRFERIYVISLAPWIPKFLSHFSFMDSKGRYDGYAEDYRYDNVEVYFAKPLAFPLEFSRKRRPDDSLRSTIKIIRENNIKFDLIHAHFTLPSGYVGAKIKEAYGKELILTVHEDRNWLLTEISAGDRKAYEAWQNADIIIRVNKADLNEFERINIDNSRLVYIPNGFSPGRFKLMDKMKARMMLGLPQSEKLLLNIAALEPYKGQEYLVDAMNKVLAAKENVALYVVGKGSLKDHLQSLIDRYGINNWVHLAGGNKTAEEIVLWMNACDLFVLPSLSEGNPTVMFEALGCGKPFLGTRVGGVPEIIINRKLGILVEPKDANALAEAIMEAIDKEWDNRYILDYASRFSWEIICQQIADQYIAVLEKRWDENAIDNR